MEEGEEVTNAEDQKVVEISLKDLARKLEEFAKARDWEKYHSPRNLLLAMVTSPILLIYVYREHHARNLHVCVFRVRSHRPHIVQDVFFFPMYQNAHMYDSVPS